MADFRAGWCTLTFALAVTSAYADGVAGTWVGHVEVDSNKILTSIPTAKQPMVRAAIARAAGATYLATFQRDAKGSLRFSLRSTSGTSARTIADGSWSYGRPEERGEKSPHLHAWSTNNGRFVFVISPTGGTLTLANELVVPAGVTIEFHRETYRPSARDRKIAGTWVQRPDLDIEALRKATFDAKSVEQEVREAKAEPDFLVELNSNGAFMGKKANSTESESGIWIDLGKTIQLVYLGKGSKEWHGPTWRLGDEWTLYGNEMESGPFEGMNDFGAARHPGNRLIMRRSVPMKELRMSEFVGRWTTKTQIEARDESPERYIDEEKRARATKRASIVASAKKWALNLRSFAAAGPLPTPDHFDPEEFDPQGGVLTRNEPKFVYTFAGGQIAPSGSPKQEAGYIAGEHGKAIVVLNGDVEWRWDVGYDETKDLQRLAAQYRDTVKELKSERETIDVFANGRAKIKTAPGSLFGGDRLDCSWSVVGDTIRFVWAQSHVKKDKDSVDFVGLSMTFGPYAIDRPGARWSQSSTEPPRSRTIVTRAGSKRK